jgi:histidine triad (HIT) family protein
MPDCIFCKIIAKEIPASIVWEDEDFLVFPDAQPVNPGHIIIIPKQHIETVFELPADLYEKFFNVAKALSTPLQKAMNSAKVGIVVKGFDVPHAHMHLIPMNTPHDIDSSRATPMDMDDRAAIAEKIKAQINKTK